MTELQLKVLAIRFTRVFVSGALGSMATFVAATQDPSIVSEFSAWLIALVMAGLTGGLAALDKLMRWTDAPKE